MASKEIDKGPAVPTPVGAWIMGAAAWAVPGLGHFLQRRWWRGLLLGGSVWTMFLLGMKLGGHLFAVTSNDQGFGIVVSGLPMVANLGSGLLYLSCWAANIGFVEKAQLVTSEYGDKFLLVAGLLNYLAMLDAFDIAAGRKK